MIRLLQDLALVLISSVFCFLFVFDIWEFPFLRSWLSIQQDVCNILTSICKEFSGYLVRLVPGIKVKPFPFTFLKIKLLQQIQFGMREIENHLITTLIMAAGKIH